MKTLTYFIADIFKEEFGTDTFQELKNVSIVSKTYANKTFSGSKLQSVIFEDVTFENCMFWSVEFENCLFINCQFINCKIKFSHFLTCNFEEVSYENCNWGVSRLQNDGPSGAELINNRSFESILPEHTLSLNLNQMIAA